MTESKPRPVVLVVEDEVGIAESLTYMMEREFLAAVGVTTLAVARERLAQGGVDLMVLDLNLPDGNGIDLLRELRAAGRSLPVIVLTSRDAEVDRVVGLELGADDYVTKPFSAREVVARVKAVLRRAHAEAVPSATAAAGLSVDLERRSAHWGATELVLTKIELDLLAALLKRPGQVLSRQQLLDRVWGDEVVIEDRTVDVHVKSLRRKIREAGGDPECVETVRGVGYRIRE